MDDIPKSPRTRRKPDPVSTPGRHRHETLTVPNAHVDKDNPPPEEGELRTLKATDLVEFNRMAESEFVYIVRNLLAAPGAMRAREVCIETAARLDISIETAKRYLLKHSASISEFSIEKGWVKERQNYKRAK